MTEGHLGNSPKLVLHCADPLQPDGRIVAVGYSQVGFRAVELLVQQGHEVVGVVTHRDDPHEKRWYHVPAEAAKKHGLACVYSDEIEGQGARYSEANQRMIDR